MQGMESLLVLITPVNDVINCSKYLVALFMYFLCCLEGPTTDFFLPAGGVGCPERGSLCPRYLEPSQQGAPGCVSPRDNDGQSAEGRRRPGVTPLD